MLNAKGTSRGHTMSSVWPAPGVGTMHISDTHTCVHAQVEERHVKLSTQFGDGGRNVVRVSLLSRVTRSRSVVASASLQEWNAGAM